MLSVNDDLDLLLRPMPELPALSERWTPRRKVALIQAVRGGWVPIEEVVRIYNLSVDEFLAWERDVDRSVSRACEALGTKSIATSHAGGKSPPRGRLPGGRAAARPEAV
jgi:hypothetical protein